MAYYHEPSDKPVYRPAFYRPVENSEKIYEVLANGISDELPDIISIIDPENMQATDTIRNYRSPQITTKPRKYTSRPLANN